jgi:hypothetical protein
MSTTSKNNFPSRETRTYDDLTALEREQFWSQLSECDGEEDTSEESDGRNTTV